jgi:hypothetical protein
MSYRLHHWQTFSSDESWCLSGMSLIDISDIQKATNKIGLRIMQEKGVSVSPDLKVFVMPILTNP